MSNYYTCPYCRKKGDYYDFYWKTRTTPVLIDDEECDLSIYHCPSCNMIWNDLEKDEMKRFIKSIPPEEKNWYNFLKDLDK